MKNYKVAFVDDDPMILTMIEAYFEHNDLIEIYKFDSGESFLKSYDDVNPDILVVDYHMDSINKYAMNGSEVVLKLMEFDVKIPIIVLSSQDNMGLALEISKFQVADYIEKKEGFLATLNKSLEDVISIDSLNKEIDEAEKVISKDYKRVITVSIAVAFFIGILTFLII